VDDDFDTGSGILLKSSNSVESSSRDFAGKLLKVRAEVVELWSQGRFQLAHVFPVEAFSAGGNRPCDSQLMNNSNVAEPKTSRCSDSVDDFILHHQID